MKEPECWEPHYRLNTCILCDHYLHDGECKACKATGFKCEDGIGRFYKKELNFERQ